MSHFKSSLHGSGMDSSQALTIAETVSLKNSSTSASISTSKRRLEDHSANSITVLNDSPTQSPNSKDPHREFMRTPISDPISASLIDLDPSKTVYIFTDLEARKHGFESLAAPISDNSDLISVNLMNNSTNRDVPSSNDHSNLISGLNLSLEERETGLDLHPTATEASVLQIFDVTHPVDTEGSVLQSEDVLHPTVVLDQHLLSDMNLHLTATTAITHPTVVAVPYLITSTVVHRAVDLNPLSLSVKSSHQTADLNSFSGISPHPMATDLRVHQSGTRMENGEDELVFFFMDISSSPFVFFF